MKDFWSYDTNEIFNRFDTCAEGLSSQEAEERIDKLGENIFEEKRSASKLMIFLSQFKNPITMILIFAAFLPIFYKIIPMG